MKIVIVAFSILPDPGPRAQRTTELVKEFARLGHEVEVYTLTGSYDFSEFENESKVKVISLGKTYLVNFDYDSTKKIPLITRALTKVFKNVLEVPYIELVRNVYHTLKLNFNADLLISIANPFPIHWGVALFKQRYPDRMKNTTWVADCGDPYMGNPFSSKPFYFKYIEKWFCRKADFISIPIEEARNAYYPEFKEKIKVIPQGFNFNPLPKKVVFVKNTIPTFIYAGNFYEKQRDPSILLDYLFESKLNFKFIVYTKTPEFLDKFKKYHGNKIEVFDYISRDKLLIEMSKADFLLNLENPTSVQSPSKLIDYALTNRPILSINTNRELDTEIINQFIQGNYNNRLVIDNIERYNITNVANQFLELIN
jgi:glycosyltransferase involved in cell wall biosynthesis